MSDQDRGLGDLPILNNPLVSTAVNLQRRHPGQMVFLEVAAAGALLYQHNRSKTRKEQIRAEADEDLRRRGWDGGAKEHQRSGMLSPAPSENPPRPTSAPPPGYVPQGYQGVGAHQRDDPMAYGALPPNAQGYPPYGAPREDPMAYGSMPGYQEYPQYQQSYGPPPPGPYQQPYGPPPGQWHQQYAQPPPGQYQQPYGPPPDQYQQQYAQPPPSAPPGYHQSYGPPGPGPYYPPS